MRQRKYYYLGFALIIILMNYVITNFASFNNMVGYLFGVIKPVFIGMVIAYFVYPLVMFIYNKIFIKVKMKKVEKLGYYLSVFVSYLLLFVIIYLLIYWLAPIIGDSISKVNKIDFDAFYKELNNTWSSFQDKYTFLVDIELIDILKNGSEKIVNMVSSGDFNKYTESILGVTSSVYAYIMGAIVSIYMIISKDELFVACDKFFTAVLSERQFRMIKKYFLHFEETFKKFFFGKMLDSLIIGILAFIGLFLLKIPFYPLLAVIVMVTNMIPYFGPFVGGIPVVLVTLFVTGDPMHTLWSGLFILALQQFDGIYLGPKILGDSVGVSSVWVIIAIIIGGALFQVAGLLLCVPFAATFKEMFNEFYEYRVSSREKDKNIDDKIIT